MEGLGRWWPTPNKWDKGEGDEKENGSRRPLITNATNNRRGRRPRASPSFESTNNNRSGCSVPVTKWRKVRDADRDIDGYVSDSAIVTPLRSAPPESTMGRAVWSERCTFVVRRKGCKMSWRTPTTTTTTISRRTQGNDNWPRAY